MPLDHRADAQLWHVDHGRRPVDDGPDRRVAGADDLIAGDQRAQPVGEVDHLWSADAGEEVLVTAREADHLVGKDRPTDDKLVVIENQFVDRHRHVHAQQAAAEMLDLGGRDDAQRAEGGRVFPVMVENAHSGIAASHLLSRRSQPPLDRLIRHRLVRSQRDQHVQRSDALRQQVVQQAKHQVDGAAARAVGDDQQHALAVQQLRGQRVSENRARFCVRQGAIGIAFSCDHVVAPVQSTRQHRQPDYFPAPH